VYRGVIPVGRPSYITSSHPYSSPSSRLVLPACFLFVMTSATLPGSPPIEYRRGRDIKTKTREHRCFPQPALPAVRVLRRLLIRGNFRSTHYGLAHRIDKKQKFCDPVAKAIEEIAVAGERRDEKSQSRNCVKRPRDSALILSSSRSPYLSCFLIRRTIERSLSSRRGNDRWCDYVPS